MTTPIGGNAAQEIADAFKLPVDEVNLDARQIAAWNRPGDDLFVSLQHLRGWNASGALAYLLSLRYAMHLESSQGRSGSEGVGE
jgi:hypothetical protein